MFKSSPLPPHHLEPFLSLSQSPQLAVYPALLPAETLKTLLLPGSYIAAALGVATTAVPAAWAKLKNSRATKGKGYFPLYLSTWGLTLQVGLAESTLLVPRECGRPRF